MTEQSIILSIALTSDRDSSIAEIEPARGAVDDEVLSWAQEARRLFEEAERRIRLGAVLPALSSLAAVHPLHGMLVNRCSEMLGQASAEDAPIVTNGPYL